MNLKLFLTSEKYDILSQWWKAWRWTPPSEDFLPECGFMVSNNGVDICAGFVYIAGSVAWIEFIVSNPEYRGRDKRREAIGFLIASLIEVAKQSGRKYCFAMLKNKSLIDIYSANGFIEGDSNSTEMILKL